MIDMNSSIMNQSTLKSTEKKTYYSLFESSELLEIVFTFVFPPISTIAFISNIVSYRIFSSSRIFQKPLYAYLKVICLNSMLINVLLGLSFLWSSRFNNGFGFLKWQAYLQCYFSYILFLASHSFGCFLEIVLALERLCELTDSRHLFHRFSPAKVCTCLLILCFLLSLPLVVLIEPKEQQFYDSSTNRTELVFDSEPTDFYLSTAGYIIVIVHLVIEEILPLFALIIINFVSFFQFRRKFMRTNFNSLLIRERKQRFNQRLNIMTENNMTYKKRIFAASKMLTKMVMIICTISTVHSVILLICSMTLRYYLNSLNFSMILMFHFSLYLKNSQNFFIFYKFNPLFRFKLKDIMKIKKNKNEYV